MPVVFERRAGGASMGGIARRLDDHGSRPRGRHEISEGRMPGHHGGRDPHLGLPQDGGRLAKNGATSSRSAGEGSIPSVARRRSRKLR